MRDASDQPATRGDLALLAQRLEQRLDKKMRLRLDAMEDRLLLQVGHAINVVEQIGKMVGVLPGSAKSRCRGGAAHR